MVHIRFWILVEGYKDVVADNTEFTELENRDISKI